MLAGDPCERSSLVVTDGRGPSGHQGNKFVGSEPWLVDASQHTVELSCVSYTCARHATSWSRAYSSKLLGFRPVSPATSGKSGSPCPPDRGAEDRARRPRTTRGCRPRASPSSPRRVGGPRT